MKRLIPLLCLAACATPKTTTIGTTWSELETTEQELRLICRIEPNEVPDAGDPDAGPDGGAVDSGTVVVHPDAGAPPLTWSLTTSGNRILLPNGQPAQLRGVNAFDPRMCSACEGKVDWAETRRKLDIVITEWKANFIRLNLEEASAAPDTYADGLLATVRHLQQYPGVYVMVAVWSDWRALTSLGTNNPNGGPAGAAHTELIAKLTGLLRDEPNVVFGCSNEPRRRTNEIEYAAMKTCVETVRQHELPGKQHLVAIQGLQNWGRNLEYYVGRELGAGVAYEAHIYDSESSWRALLAPAATLPTIIGEFGAGSQMSQASVEALMRYAEASGIPWLAWAFAGTKLDGTGGCAPNLLGALQSRCNSAVLPMSTYGATVKARLALPWGAP